jgi:heme exporter protein CcmB
MLRAILLIVRKDLTVEVRSRELAYTTLFFAVSCVLVFAFSLVQEGRAADGVGAGVLWMAIMFAGNLALGRTFERERQSETLRALMLVPAPRPAVYLGKLTGIVLLLLLTDAVLVGLLVVAREDHHVVIDDGLRGRHHRRDHFVFGQRLAERAARLEELREFVL